jgi:hypothetical protein
MCAVASEVVCDGGVDKLGAIVGLDGDDGKVKLSACIGKKINKCVGSVRLPPKRKCPHVVRVVINDNKIIFKARIAKNRRCPQITMN